MEGELEVQASTMEHPKFCWYVLVLLRCSTGKAPILKTGGQLLLKSGAHAGIAPLTAGPHTGKNNFIIPQKKKKALFLLHFFSALSADLVFHAPCTDVPSSMGRKRDDAIANWAYLEVGRQKGTGWGVQEKEMKDVRGKWGEEIETKSISGCFIPEADKLLSLCCENFSIYQSVFSVSEADVLLLCNKPSNGE